MRAAAVVAEEMVAAQLPVAAVMVVAELVVLERLALQLPAQQTLAVVAVVLVMHPVVTVAPASSSFVTQAPSAAPVAQSHRLAATPITPSLHLGRTQHEPLCKSQQRHRRAGHRGRA